MKLKFISLQEVSILSPCVFPFFPETDIIEVLLFEVIKDEAEVDTVGVEAFVPYHLVDGTVRRWRCGERRKTARWTTVVWA